MSVYLSNAFSLQMQGGNECSTRRVTLDEARAAVIGWQRVYDGISVLSAESIVGHADIAEIISAQLGVGVEVPVKRVSVSLKVGDTLVVGQYVGPRLPEGCKELPEGARIEWYMVSCRKAGEIAELEKIRADLAKIFLRKCF